MSMTSQHAALLDWARLVVVLGARCYRAVLLALSAVALAPMLFAWGSFLVTSESMRPAISVGDVVVGKHVVAEDQVAVGRVYVFRDPAPTADDLIVHRVVELRDDGYYTTAGDANDVTDSDSVATADLHSRAVLLVPHIGLPVIWATSGEWYRLALWLLVTIAAFWAASRNVGGEPPKWTLLRLVRDRAHGERRRTPDRRGNDAEAPGEVPEGARDAVGIARRCAAAGAAGLALALIGTAGGTAHAGFTSRTGNGPMSWSVGQWTQRYVAEVLTDRPYAFWLLDEPAGAVSALDRSGRSTPGRYGSAAVLGRPGALPGNPGTSMRTSSGVALTSASAMSAPGVQSVELWFRTSAVTGGHLVGFADSSTATSAIEDRVLRMSVSGQLTYGDWPTNPQRVITTPRAYNDGSWHHVVLSFSPANGSFQDAAIYVDGALVTSGGTSKVRSYTGYWRVGGGSRDPAFNGFVDNVALYGVELGPQRVAAHYAAR
jgi:signal peptidase I